MRDARRARRSAGGSRRRARPRTGLRYVRRHVVAVGHASSAPRSPTCCSWGRPRCCSRSSSRTSSDGSAADLGLVFAAGGLGSMACAVAMGQRGLPRRDITFMYIAWTLATLAVAGYGLAHGRLAADAGERRCSTRSRRPARSSGRRPSSATSRGAAGPGVEPRLADLDRPAAGVVRAHGAGQPARSGRAATLIGAGRARRRW